MLDSLDSYFEIGKEAARAGLWGVRNLSGIDTTVRAKDLASGAWRSASSYWNWSKPREEESGLPFDMRRFVMPVHITGGLLTIATVGSQVLGGAPGTTLLLQTGKAMVDFTAHSAILQHYLEDFNEEQGQSKISSADRLWQISKFGIYATNAFFTFLVCLEHGDCQKSPSPFVRNVSSGLGAAATVVALATVAELAWKHKQSFRPGLSRIMGWIQRDPETGKPEAKASIDGRLV
ncbi:MAG: hypothetical protein KDK78_11120 [Chlamydiia bacterium]|nr:hypothetical protein [Chlamydiia bacterium]